MERIDLVHYNEGRTCQEGDPDEAETDDLERVSCPACVSRLHDMMHIPAVTDARSSAYFQQEVAAGRDPRRRRP